MTSQGFDKADFHCGRCLGPGGPTFTATTADDYALKYAAHQLAHDILDAATPEERARIIDAALEAVR